MYHSYFKRKFFYSTFTLILNKVFSIKALDKQLGAPHHKTVEVFDADVSSNIHFNLKSFNVITKLSFI